MGILMALHDIRLVNGKNIKTEVDALMSLERKNNMVLSNTLIVYGS